MRLPIVLVVALALVAGAAWAGSYNSNGFEQPTFVPGPLAGQDGWTVYTAGPGGVAPTVVTALTDPTIQDQSVRLEVGDTQGDVSEMDHMIGVTPGPTTIMTVMFDVYRVEPAQGMRIQNLWWYWHEWDFDQTGSTGYGLQWDGTVATHPFGFGPSSPIVFNHWTNVKLVWDFNTMTAYGLVDGNLINTTPFTWDGRTLTGYGIYLGHESDTGTGPDVAWIDNFQVEYSGEVVPEPSSLFALAGFLPALALLRRRR